MASVPEMKVTVSVDTKSALKALRNLRRVLNVGPWVLGRECTKCGALHEVFPWRDRLPRVCRKCGNVRDHKSTCGWADVAVRSVTIKAGFFWWQKTTHLVKCPNKGAL
jgi:hypothetical protein